MSDTRLQMQDADTCTYKQTDSIDALTPEQLDLIARTQHDILLRYIEKSTIFDVHRIRLMLELGAAEAARRLEALRSNPTAKRRPLVGVRLSARLGLVATPPNLGTTQGEPTGWPLSTEACEAGRIGAR